MKLLRPFKFLIFKDEGFLSKDAILTLVPINKKEIKLNLECLFQRLWHVKLTKIHK
jgi:hypothetical protein